MGNDADWRAAEAVESILDNESLTDGLDDPSAKVLLDWAVAQAEALAGRIQDQELLEEKLHALRKLMRLASKLVVNVIGATILVQILDQAAAIYREESNAE